MQQPARNWPAAKVSRLYDRHPQSQNYFYTRNLSDLVEELVTPYTLRFDDQLMLDFQDEMLKRRYSMKEVPVKLQTMSEYLQYQQPVPPIFHKEIEELHVRWRQRKQKLLVKQLQHVFHIDQQSSNKPKEVEEQGNLSNLLGEISEYNPQSTNYYLRKGRNSRMGRNSKLREPDCSSLLSIQKELNSMLSRCSFVAELSVLADRMDQNEKLRPLVNFNSADSHRQKYVAATAYNFRRKNQEDVKLRDKIVLTFHPSFLQGNHSEKKQSSAGSLKIADARCLTTDKNRQQRANSTSKVQLNTLPKRTESDGRLRIRLQRSNSREKAPSVQLKRLPNPIKDRVNSHPSEQLGDLRNYRTTVLKKDGPAPRNFLTLNMEATRPIRPIVRGNNPPLRLRGV